VTGGSSAGFEVEASEGRHDDDLAGGFVQAALQGVAVALPGKITLTVLPLYMRRIHHCINQTFEKFFMTSMLPNFWLCRAPCCLTHCAMIDRPSSRECNF
jgi:hypothetical protein